MGITQDKINQAVAALSDDSARMNVFVNGDDATEYTANDGTKVPSIKRYLRRLGDLVGGMNIGNDGGVLVQQPFAGAIARTQHDKNAEIVSLKDFYSPTFMGDYTQALERAFESGVQVLHGSGAEYNVTDGAFCTRGGLTLRDMTLNVVAQTANSSVLKFDGTQSNMTALTEDAGLFTAIVSSVNGFAQDDWVYIESGAEWSGSAEHVKLGECAQIASVDSASKTLTFYVGLVGIYKVADGATVSKINTLKNIVLEGVSAKGLVSTDNQHFIQARHCEGLHIQNVRSQDFDYDHILLNRCINTNVYGGSSTRVGQYEGLDYGLVIAEGCFNTMVDGYTTSAMRHGFAIGGSNGVSRFTSIINCRSFSMHDALFDSHSGAAEVNYSFNIGSLSSDIDTEMDGIAAQCASLTAIGNRLIGCRRHGIAWEPSVNLNVYRGQVGITSANNHIEATQNKVGTGTSCGLYISSNAAAINQVISNNDSVTGHDNHTYVVAGNNTIDTISITTPRGKSLKIRGIHVYANRSSIGSVGVFGGHLNKASAYECVFFQGSSGKEIMAWSIGGGIHLMDTTASSVALRVSYANNGLEAGMYTNCNITYVFDNAPKYSCTTPLKGKYAWGGGTVNSGSIQTILVPVAGADYGDFANVNISTALQDATISANVTGSNTVKVVLKNDSGVARTYPACDVNVSVFKSKQ